MVALVPKIISAGFFFDLLKKAVSALLPAFHFHQRQQPAQNEILAAEVAGSFYVFQINIFFH